MITVYAAFDNARLRYVLDWILKERWNVDYTLVHDEAAARAAPFLLSYGMDFEHAVFIPDNGMLRGKGGSEYMANVYGWDHGLFGPLHFDLLAAIFWNLARCEEYEPHSPDRHGRFPHEQSKLFRNGWLERPLVDEWLHRLKWLFEEKTGYTGRLAARQQPPWFLPTYDIDIAWSYRHKGLVRSAGAFVKNALSLRWGAVKQRLLTATGQATDPYDSFALIEKLHAVYTMPSLFFVLAAEQTSAFDKNIAPGHPKMQQLIRELSGWSSVNLHPSYFSQEQPERFAREKNILEQVTGQPIDRSRQHFIRMSLPATYRFLLAQGIRDDYSMGYATHIGFRAGTSFPFFWYDLEKEEQTSLRVHPFCFMDTTARFFMKLSSEDAFRRLWGLRNAMVNTGGSLVTVFHNFSLGTDPGWKGWREEYISFMAANGHDPVGEEDFTF